MATLTIKNIPDELYEQLKQSASRHRRSVNSEVIVCLEKVLGSSLVDPATFLASIGALRKKIEFIPIKPSVPMASNGRERYATHSRRP
jgi:plasmid stability protein